ncbi:DUF6622 family protein [Massilia soli]|uniref:Tat pathway signal sequence n=1 Tax=Massilia soli TaxID=2792854 RepID=A0ABS7SIE9_9BURK|nr:DUF6622 family protein [Massilia soli]MBZ2205874.1 hypothetical protein [Massilia soli]
MSQILTHTPPWVFALFAGLLAFGLLQTRSRNVNRTMAYLLPAGMVALSLSGVQSSFGLAPVPVALWATGLIVVAFAGYKLFPNTRLIFDPATNSFFIPGSWYPLAVIMAIFLTKYAFAVMTAMKFGAVNSPAFAMAFSLAYGCFSGYFAARAANLVAQTKASGAALNPTPV